MRKAINKRITKKKSGRPAGSVGAKPAMSVTAVRLPGDLTAKLDAWGSDNEVSRSEAIRRLVEKGLKAK